MPAPTFLPGQAYPERYATELERKLEQTSKQFQNLYSGNIEVYPSPPHSYRMRAEFRIWHNKEQCFYAMFPNGSREAPVAINTFSIGSQQIQTLMPILLAYINRKACLSERLFQVEFLSSTRGDLLVTLVYHRVLSAEWEQAAKQLESELNLSIVGRSRRQKIILSRDYIEEEFKLNDTVYLFQQIESSFTQPNAFVCRTMLEWALRTVKTLGGDLIELYCGNGNFTVPLSTVFNKVFATEISKASVRAATYNLSKNQRENVQLARLSSEEVAAALSGERVFKRLDGIDLNSYQFSTIMVDPPRAGLDQKTLDLAKTFPHVLYISCNPDSLLDNLNSLCQSHRIANMALFDQFPYTDHREVGVMLERI